MGPYLQPWSFESTNTVWTLKDFSNASNIRSPWVKMYPFMVPVSLDTCLATLPPSFPHESDSCQHDIHRFTPSTRSANIYWVPDTRNTAVRNKQGLLPRRAYSLVGQGCPGHIWQKGHVTKKHRTGTGKTCLNHEISSEQCLYSVVDLNSQVSGVHVFTKSLGYMLSVGEPETACTGSWEPIFKFSGIFPIESVTKCIIKMKLFINVQLNKFIKIKVIST